MRILGKKNIIIGAGPAGLQMAYMFEQRNEQYIIIERSDKVGSFFRQYPRQRKLISVNKVNHVKGSDEDFSLRFDWNSLLEKDAKNRFTKYSEDLYPNADTLCDYLDDYVTRNKLQISFNTKVVEIDKRNTTFHIKCICDGEEIKYECHRLFIATGVKQREIPSVIKEEADRQNYKLYDYTTMPLDPNEYRGKNIIIVGTGNAAYETANYLNSYANSIALVGPEKQAWRTHYPGHLRSINMSFLDTFYLKIGNVIYFDYDIRVVSQQQNAFLKAVNNECVTHIIYCGGFRFDSSIFSTTCMPNIENNSLLPIINDKFESVNIKHLYFIGTCMQLLDYKKGSSAFIHGFRYNIEFLDRVLQNDIDAISIDTKADLLDKILYRLNNSSCLHHRYGYFCDIIIPTDDGKYTYYENIYERYSPRLIPKGKKVCRLYFGFGNEFKATLKQPDIIIPFRDNISYYLHPIMEMYDPKYDKRFTFHVGESPTVQFVYLHQEQIEIYLDFLASNMTNMDYSKVEAEIILHASKMGAGIDSHVRPSKRLKISDDS